MRGGSLCLGNLLAHRFPGDSNRDDVHLGCEKGGHSSWTGDVSPSASLRWNPGGIGCRVLWSGKLENIPETSELRKFKYLSSQEKWVVVRRGSEVAVFKVGPDAQTIRSSGLYVGIEPDTLRGTASLLRDLQGHDKLHLCRTSLVQRMDSTSSLMA